MSKLSLIRGTLAGAILFGGAVVAQAQPGAATTAKTVVVAEAAGETVPQTQKKYVGTVEPIEKAALVARVAGTLLARQRAASAQGTVADGVDGLYSDTSVVANALEKTLKNMNDAGILADLPGVKTAMEDSLKRLRVSDAASNETFEEGGLVEAGQKLFTVDKTRYQASVGVAIATIQELVERIKYAQTNFDRVGALYAKQAGSLDDMQKAETELRSVQAQLGLAASQLKLSVDDLYHADVYSPIAGRVGRVERTTGNFVSANDELATVVQTNPIYVRFSLSERDFLSMFDGDFDKLKNEARIALKLSDGEYYKKRGTDEICYGTVAMRDNVVKTTTDTVKVWATFENPTSETGAETLVSGGVVTVELTRSEGEKTAAVKPSAVMFDEEGYFVYVLTDGLSTDELYDAIAKDGRFKAQIAEVESGAKTRDEFMREFYKRYETVDRITKKVLHVSVVDGKIVDEGCKMVLRRPVVPGPTQGSAQAIYSGLEPGEIVVMDGTHKAKPFDVVLPVADVADDDSVAAAPKTDEANAEDAEAESDEPTATDSAASSETASSVFSKENLRFLATGTVVAFPLLGFAFFRARRRGLKNEEAELK